MPLVNDSCSRGVFGDKINERVLKAKPGADECCATIVVIDIRHSTAILEGLTEAETPRIWAAVVEEIDKTLRISQGDKFLVYKFLGDGWILISENASPSTMSSILSMLRSIDNAFCYLYRRQIADALRSTLPNPEITFGITTGRLLKFTLNGAIEYVGKAINEACRLQGRASELFPDKASRGLIDTGSYSAFGGILKSAKRQQLKLKNVSNGKKIFCYSLVLAEWDLPET